jgi:hypothetical protein
MSVFTKYLLASALAMFSAFAHGQEKVTIEDPDITFSYERPKGWQSQDDPLYHFVTKPAKNPAAPGSQVAITYYDGSCNDLDECFEAQEKGYLPSVVGQFKKLDSGEDRVNETRAKWIKYSGIADSLSPDAVFVQYAYFFIKHNQYFVVNIILPYGDSEAEIEALSIVRSLTAWKN